VRVRVRACVRLGERWGREREEWWLFVADVFL